MKKILPEKAVVMDFISFAEKYPDTFESIAPSYYIPSAERIYVSPRRLEKTLHKSCFGSVISYFLALEEDVAAVHRENIKIIL